MYAGTIMANKSKTRPMTPSEILSSLKSQQFNKDQIKNLLKDIQRIGGDEEAIKALLNKEIPRIIGNVSSPRTTAYLTDRVLQQIIGTAALDEIPGLSELSHEDAFKKILNEAYGDVSKIEKELGLSPNIKFEGVLPSGYFQSAADYSPASGIRINEAYKKDPSLLTQMLGSVFHEGSHRPNSISTALAALANKGLRNNISYSKYTPEYLKNIRENKIPNRIIDQDVLDYYRANNLAAYENLKAIADAKKLKEQNKEQKSISDLVKEYVTKNPNKLDETNEILDWQAMPHRTEAQFNKSMQDLGITDPKDLSHLELQNLLSGKDASHWYKKNFPLEGVLGLAKSGLKGIRSITPILKTAGKIGLPLAAAASNYAEASEMGLPTPLAAAYAGAEEFNPLPISGIDYYKGMQEAAEGRKQNIESMYMPEEMKMENKSIENYKKSQAAKDRALNRIREILKPKE